MGPARFRLGERPHDSMPRTTTPARPLEFQEWLVARSDASQHAGQSGSTRRLVSWLGLAPGARVLDLGCGSAKSAVLLSAEHGARVVGLDRSARSLARAQWRAHRTSFRAGLSLVRANAESLPFRAATFDAVLLEAVAYAAPLELLLRELRRVLVPGGRVGMVDIARRPGRVPPADDFQRLLGERTLNLFSVCEWRDRMREAGFESVRAEGFAIRQDIATVREELGDWLRSLPRQLAWLAKSARARQLFFANYRVGLDPGIEGCLLVASSPLR